MGVLGKGRSSREHQPSEASVVQHGGAGSSVYSPET